MRCTMGSRSSVERNVRNASGAGVGRESAIDKKRACMQVLITVSGRACIVEAGWIGCGGWTRKKVSIEFTEIRATHTPLPRSRCSARHT